jgi:3-hydroxy-9,10-secoandrosta-1,3,5(10)-triene-9,17-dione monooxygenase reductase component
MVTTSRIEARIFRDVLGHLPTGACVVTSFDALGKPVGLSCNSFTSVSLAPPLVSFCPSKSSATWSLMRPSGHFAVHVLAEGQAPLCLQFARHGIDRFADVDWRESRRGNPLLKGVLAWLECEMVDEHDAGDHTIVVAAVHELERAGGTGPLIFFRGRYGRLQLD